MFIPRKPNELAISHSIRLMRFQGNPNLSEVSKQTYGGFRKNALIPWKAKEIHNILTLETETMNSEATDLPFLVKLGGHPWPKQLLARRQHTPESYWAYLLEKSSPTPYFRYCSVCAANEYQETGGAWWHVEHNLPGVLSCVHHEIILNDVSWGDVTNGWGGLPHHYMNVTKSELDSCFAVDFSRVINKFQKQKRRYCPFIVAIAAMESVRRVEGCQHDQLIDAFMDRFSYRFPHQIQTRMARYESILPDCQVLRLLKDSVVESPLATALVAMSVFSSIEQLERAYINLTKGSTLESYGEITLGRNLDKLLDCYPKLMKRVIFH